MERTKVLSRADATRDSAEPPLQHRELLFAIASVLALLWINAYICRELFSTPTAYMNSMHGFWIALAKRAGSSWFQPTWWPYWDCGIPFEWTYAPLVPALTAAGAVVRGTSLALAFQSISGLAYCLGPVCLFLMAWVLTRSPGFSFLAGLFYSLVAPEQILAPDGPFSLHALRDPRRLFLLTVWDDTPHLVALSLWPLAILFLVLSIKKRRLVYYLVASLLIALMAAASEFGPVLMVIGSLCLLSVFGRREFRRNVAITASVGIFSYAMVAPFLPPSMFVAIRQSSAAGEYAWNGKSALAAVLVLAGGLILWRCLLRWSHDWTLQFFVLLAYVISSVPLTMQYFHTQFLPQPGRYKLEMELVIALALVFGLRTVLRRFPPKARVALFLAALVPAGAQIVSYRRYAKSILRSANEEQTIEYRAAMWSEQNLPGIRIMLPGTIAQWANAFTEVQQLAGGAWSKAYNPIQQDGRTAVYSGGGTKEEDAQVSLTWLQVYGVGAVGISGPKSQEFWKPYAHPTKFDGVLPMLWRADDVTIYAVPQRTNSLAHVVPESALVRHAPKEATDTAEISRYRLALEDSSLPAAHFRWEGRNHIRIQTEGPDQQALSIQVNYHPGWHASVGGRAVKLQRDALGLMWLKPECGGPCEIRLDYDGGLELRLCHLVSTLAMLVWVSSLIVVFGLRLRSAIR